MTWVNLTFQVNLEVNDPDTTDFRTSITKISRIISECLDITDERMIEPYDSVKVDWKAVE